LHIGKDQTKFVLATIVSQ